MEDTQIRERIIFVPTDGEPVLYRSAKKIPAKLEKPLKAVSMLKKELWETEISLFGAKKGEILYPSTMKEEEVRNLFKKMKNRRKKWLLWLCLVFPLTFILTPIPGPNLVYYYVLGRIILHFKSILGINNVLKNFKFTPVENILRWIESENTELYNGKILSGGVK